MLTNYIKIALRNILRNKLHSFINIIGLSIGMACAIMLLLFVRDELSYDRHHSKHERIYMVQTQFRFGDRKIFDHGSYFATGPTLKDEYPIIEESVRIYESGRIFFVDNKKELIGEDNIRYADPEIFRVFDHKFIYGSPEGALDAPHTIVLNETLAKKYFGEQNPVGKTILKNNGTEYTVTGVFEDLPHNSYVRYNALIPMTDLSEVLGEETINSRSSSQFYSSMGGHLTFILLRENTNIENITDDFERFRDKYLIEHGKILDGDFNPVFQPLSDVYLYLSYKDIPIVLFRIYIISSLALLILIIACINYMNMSTATSAGRAREVGIRKVLGAYRASLIRQFLCESVIITTTGLLFALVLVELFLPTFNSLADKEINFSILAKPGIFGMLFIFTLLVGLIAGSYPAFFLSSFLPVKALKGDTQFGRSRGILRHLLVVVQFMLSIIVIVFTMASQEQMRYIRHMDLGFNKDNIIIFSTSDPEVIKTISAFKKEIIRNKEVSVVAKLKSPIGLGVWNKVLKIESPRGDLIDKLVSYSRVDFDFIDLMEIEILEGRSFSREMGTDQKDAVLINETLAKEMGWTDSPIGKRIRVETRDGKVIGVLKDFHYQHSREKIGPMVIIPTDEDNINDLPVVYIKLRSSYSRETIDYIKEKWAELNPTYPFEYTFLEDRIADQYKSEEGVYRILSYSAFLSIFISCLGLFGLSSFIVEKKTKEIGIRKAHGASIWNILYHLVFDFIKLVLISSLLAWPVLPLLNWLPDVYAYYPETNHWLFIYTVCIVLAVAIITVSHQTVRAALNDPVKALRYE